MKSSYRARNGHERDKVVHKNMNSRAKARRIGALKRLEASPDRPGKEKEIQTLKSRI